MGEGHFGFPKYPVGARHADEIHLGGMRLPDEPGFDVPGDDGPADEETKMRRLSEAALSEVGTSLARGMKYALGIDAKSDESTKNDREIREMEQRLSEVRRTYFDAFHNLAECIPDTEGKGSGEATGRLSRLIESSKGKGEGMKKRMNLLKGLIVTLALSGGGQAIGTKDAEASPNRRKSIIEQSLDYNMRNIQRRVANGIFSIPDRALTNAEQVARQQEAFNRNAIRIIHAFESERVRLDNQYIIRESRGDDPAKLDMEKRRDLLNMATGYLRQTENMADNRMNGVGIPRELDRFHTDLVNLIEDVRDSLRGPSRMHGNERYSAPSMRDREDSGYRDMPPSRTDRGNVNANDLDVILGR